MKYLASLLLLAASCVPCPAQLEVTGDNIKVVKVSKVITVEEDRTVVNPPFQVKAPAGGFGYVWSVPAGVTFTRKANVIEVESVAKAGCITISAEYTLVDFEAKKFETKFDETKVHVGGIAPQPLPPGPVDPPDVKPVAPPIPFTGVRVLVICEATDGGVPLSRDQRNEVNSKAFSDYVNAKCAKGPSGTPEVRFWDDEVAGLDKAPAWWQSAMKLPRTDDRWLIVQGPNAFYSGPLPKGGEILTQIKAIVEK